MANLITLSRIVLSLALLFCPANSVVFFVIYVIAGVTDMLDGFVARKTGTVSERGSRLDTLADLTLVAVCALKLLPIYKTEIYIYIWIGAIALKKAVNIISGLVKYKKVIAVHSVLNKIIGALLFALPLALIFADIRYLAPPLCALATVAAVIEGHQIRTGDYT